MPNAADAKSLTDLDQQLEKDREREGRPGRRTQAKYKIFATFVRLTHSPKREKITVDAICKLANLSTATFYKHFEHGIDELIFHFALRIAHHIAERTDFDCNKLGIASAHDRLTITVARMADVLTRYPSMFSVDAFPQAAREQLSKPLLLALLSGESGDKNLDLKAAQIAALYHINGLIALLMVDPLMDYREIAHVLVEQVVPSQDRAGCLELLARLTYDKTETDKHGQPKLGYVHLGVTKPFKTLVNPWVPLETFKPPKPARRTNRPSGIAEDNEQVSV